MEAKTPPVLTLEERVARLEGALGWSHEKVPLGDSMFYAGGALGLFSLALCYVGLGTPNHYYQFVFAAITIALAYHQGWFALPKKTHHWALALVNVVVLAMLYKLVIGSGVVEPFFWAKVPVINSAEGGFSMLPKANVTWQKTALAAWSIDLTIVQTFLLLVTLVGALFEFQPFASLTAFFLVIVSLPALVDFNWHWVFPAIISAAISLYLQSADSNAEP